jgi:hypothetical protein
MNLEVGQTYSFKLNSGEELVAKLVEAPGEYYVISNPVSIGPNPKGGLGLVPSMFTVSQDADVRLNINSISIVAETDENVKMKYIEATTGLTVPDKKVILG